MAAPQAFESSGGIGEPPFVGNKDERNRIFDRKI
jgi:hypothetical protein